MNGPVLILNSVLVIFTCVSLVYLVDEVFGKKAPILLGIGFLTDFLDTLGIGSFAPSTALFRATKTVDDKDIPGTLNVGHTVPVVMEAVIFMTAIEVEPVTLIAMLASATLGAVIGAGIVSKLNVRMIRLAMGAALLAVVGIMLCQQFGIFPAGGETIGLTGVKLVIGVVFNFILGALMTIGIGLYAPCMALVFALGMSPAVAFPIMMGSCAFLMPAASIRFVKSGAHNKAASICVTIGGAVGVLVATNIITSMPLDMLKILVMVVVTYTAATMLKDGLKA